MLYLRIFLISIVLHLNHLLSTNIKLEIVIEAISGGKHPESVQNNVICLLFVKSVNIVGSFLRDSNREKFGMSFCESKFLLMNLYVSENTTNGFLT